MGGRSGRRFAGDIEVRSPDGRLYVLAPDEVRSTTVAAADDRPVPAHTELTIGLQCRRAEQRGAAHTAPYSEESPTHVLPPQYLRPVESVAQVGDSILRLTTPDEVFGECDGALHRPGAKKLLVRPRERGQLRFGILDTAAPLHDLGPQECLFMTVRRSVPAHG
ncbi:hypothetical protein [Streptomyces sp. NPDC101149]|uniref:hypothetical protein n=1 Tax=Streptomyces sp. NPDC101149 TaxID=3366113 RepID=UPI003803074B